MQNELRLMIHLFEKKINEAEKDYKEKHKENFSIQKMKKYVNKKLEKERKTLIRINLIPTIQILNHTEKYKY